ncbi:uncharacterized protein LOC132720430 isoform X2 [Ruditapes philippinarum]|uniref:uncharacterized protein LOC132720430 isoform X2 n=1 Tax=Ruditapes philippinarum TaxID=129788 RepID=UPI00295ADA2C|nr:uncharacterized protein LOC132720430 isoform X2 [Ruditapes philippinarum]
MENMFGIMHILVIAAFLLVDHGVIGGCVEDKTDVVKPCFDLLMTAMNSQKPKDVNDFLCSDSQKENLDCVIKGFHECPDFKKEAFIEGLKDSSFKAIELFHVASADEFCECAATFTYMIEVESQLGKELRQGPWPKTANHEYICGVKRYKIDRVAKSLPVCADYLKYKHNETTGDNSNVHSNVKNFQYAAEYADKYCTKFPKGFNDTCSMERISWSSLELCHGQIDNLQKVTDQECQMRRCVALTMRTCPKGEMEYFIDAINVFSDVRISKDETCSKASGFVASVLSTLVLCLICILF